MSVWERLHVHTCLDNSHPHHLFSVGRQDIGRAGHLAAAATIPKSAAPAEPDTDDVYLPGSMCAAGPGTKHLPPRDEPAGPWQVCMQRSCALRAPALFRRAARRAARARQQSSDASCASPLGRSTEPRRPPHNAQPQRSYSEPCKSGAPVAGVRGAGARAR